MSVGVVAGLVLALGVVAGVYLGRGYEKGRRAVASFRTSLWASEGAVKVFGAGMGVTGVLILGTSIWAGWV